MSPRLTFAGAARGVTGSCYHLEKDGFGLVIDCGIFQGEDGAERNLEPFPFDAASVDAVVLTHGHLDHVGRLPLLSMAGFRGQVQFQAEAVVAHAEVLHGAHVAIHDVQRLTAILGAGHPVPLEVHQQPLLDVQLGETVRGDAQCPLHFPTAQVVVQVDHLREPFALQRGYGFTHIFRDGVHLGHARRMRDQVAIHGLGEEVDLRLRPLRFQAPQHRRCEDDVANGGEADDQDLHGAQPRGPKPGARRQK